ncbi:MAG: TonB-dependent receptor domain-containing protein [Lewinella sp.]|uniref:TonB-dependent receptor domain-containing protein n=1 Tax=Lewinella sp. TaxID=2004506 RepID=UPI003D6B9560
MKHLLLTLFSILTLFSLQAQQSLTGTITDTGDQPLAFANVLLLQAEDTTFIKGAITDLDGLFTITNIPPGAYFIRASMMGYEEQQTPLIQVRDHQQATPLSFSLREDVTALDEVTVTAKKPLFEQQIDRTIINVQNSITAAGATALDILERSPGVRVDRINNQITMQAKQGVVIMLNGKRIRMEVEGLIQYLQSMSADNIEKIELITTPPASFDAEGNAGIINIVTINKTEDGLSGSATLNTGYGLRPKYGASINMNLRTRKVNLFTDFSANYDYTRHKMDIYRKNTFGQQVTTANIHSDRPALTKIYNGRIGLDFYASDQTIVGGMVSGFYRHWFMEAETRTTLTNELEEVQYNDLLVEETNEWNHWLANLNIRHTFTDKSSLAIDFDFLDYFDRNPVNYQESNRDQHQLLLSERDFSSTKETPIGFTVLKADYSKEWNDQLKFQTGFKGTNSSFTNKLSLFDLENGDRIYDQRFTDSGTLKEMIGAVYFSADYTLSDAITTKIGGRYEYYDSQLTSSKEGPISVQKFGRFFPSIFLTYQLDDNNQLQFSYAERINRPAFSELAPFFLFFGYNTVFTGNPKVKPTISQQISASFRHKSLLINMEFSDQDNPISFQPQVNAEENLFIANAENMEDAKSAMISVNTPFQIADWWETRLNVAAYWIRLQPRYEGELITVTNTYLTANLAQNFQLPKRFQFEITTQLNSARQWGLGQTRPYAALNMGLQKSIGENTKMSFNWSNMFDLGAQWIYEIDRPELNLEYSWKYRMEGNIFRLSLTHQFGNPAVKKANQRATGSEEEQRRLN